MKAIRTVSALLLCLLLCAAGGCTESERTDYSELNRRLKRENEAYGFCEEELLYNEGVYYAVTALPPGKKVLLTMREDEEGRLDQITVTASGEDVPDGFAEVCTDYCAAVVRAFVPSGDDVPLAAAVGGYTHILYTECVRRERSGMYTMELFSDPVGISLLITRSWDASAE